MKKRVFVCSLSYEDGLEKTVTLSRKELEKNLKIWESSQKKLDRTIKKFHKQQCGCGEWNGKELVFRKEGK